jgi:glycosyltransferase involved in cell wall biosynthesis
MDELTPMVPKLSVIVISYNMARELPRTIRTLVPPMQRDISACDYEIIIVDNGSTQAFAAEQILRLGSNISIHYMDDATPSPVPAVNYGLSLARGDLIGVMIDGARMVSPRLLATALEAAQLHQRPIIGTLSFHLGPDRQLHSVGQGYCQEVEDQLLASVDWISDAYRLFEISVFAGSSEKGWFVVPWETDALFLTREHWKALGGYDPAFVSPGGGGANIDMWSRACADPAGRIILLLGEGTFHQVHGGLTTSATSQSPIWQEFRDEWTRLRGEWKLVFQSRPPVKPLLIGHLHHAALASVKLSADLAATG